jgi:uncharacterized protein YkwD
MTTTTATQTSHTSHTSARRWLARLLASVTGLGIAAGILLSLGTSANAATPLTAATAKTYARHMLIVLNAERRIHHRAPLHMNLHLITSGHRHDLDMARNNQMSHQLPGEAFFATRITRAGYNWVSAGENIGWTSNLTNRGLLNLEKQMYTEKAPDNGHRLNILNPHYRSIGISIYFDTTHHKMWFTQDFGQPA